MFLQVSVCPQGGCLPQCMVGYTPPRADTPQEQTPPRADIPPVQTPPLGADTPRSRHPLGADTQWRIQDFPEGGREPSRGGVNTPNFPENCMKSKEFGRPGGACVPHAPPRSANADTHSPPGAYTPPPREQTPPSPRDGHCCGRYSSYWNAFLFTV